MGIHLESCWCCHRSSFRAPLGAISSALCTTPDAPFRSRAMREGFEDFYQPEYGLGCLVCAILVTEAGSYLRLITFCTTQLKAQGPSRTCDENKEEEYEHSSGRIFIFARQRLTQTPLTGARSDGHPPGIVLVPRVRGHRPPCPALDPEAGGVQASEAVWGIRAIGIGGRVTS